MSYPREGCFSAAIECLQPSPPATDASRGLWKLGDGQAYAAHSGEEGQGRGAISHSG